MSKIYENVYIGSFIFACGKYAGALDGNASVNLYQQTPNDKRLGDVLFGAKSRILIIEFKKSAEDLVTELHKPHRLRFLKKMQDEENVPEIWSISSRAHFLGFPDEFKLHFTSYVKYLTMKDSDLFSMNHFIKEMYEPTQDDWMMSIPPKVGVSYNDFVLYLRYIYELKDDDMGDAIGGLVVAVNEQRQITLIPFESIRELSIVLSAPMPKMLANQIKETQEEIQQEIKNDTEQIRVQVGDR